MKVITCLNCQTVNPIVAKFCCGCGGVFQSFVEKPSLSKPKSSISGGVIALGTILAAVALCAVITLFIKPTRNNSQDRMQTSIKDQKTVSPTNYSTPIQSTENIEFSMEEAAIGGIIGADDMKLPKSDDVRVKRVIYLLKEISNHTKETPIEITNAVNAMSKLLKENYGKIVTRQQLLEETKEFFATADKKMSVNQKTKDVMLLALMKYGS